MIIKNGNFEFTGTEAELLSMLGAKRLEELKRQLTNAATATPPANANTTTPAPATNGAEAITGQSVVQMLRDVLPALVQAIRGANNDERGEERDGLTYERTADGHYVRVPRERSAPGRWLDASLGRIRRYVPERLRPGTVYLPVAGFEEHEASVTSLAEALQNEDVASSSSPWVAAGFATVLGGALGAWLASED